MNNKKNLIAALAMLGLLLATAAPLLQAAQSQLQPGTLVNINTADAKTLDKLPRIGARMAERIIEYRKANGGFKRIQDLMKVKGIGEKVFEKLKSLVTV